MRVLPRVARMTIRQSCLRGSESSQNESINLMAGSAAEKNLRWRESVESRLKNAVINSWS